MATMLSYFQADPEMREAFIRGAFKINPNIKDFPDFVEAENIWLDTPQGRGAKEVMEDQSLKFLFEDGLARRLIAPNISKREFNSMFERTDGEVFGDAPYEVQKEKKRERIIFNVYQTGKLVKVKEYTRKSTNKRVSAYASTRRKWDNIEENFVINLKKKNIKPKEIVLRYNRMFKDKPRTRSSISTKYQRL